MPRVEDILKSAGWSDADLESVKEVLANDRFRSSVESQYSALESEKQRLSQINEDWNNKLEQEYKPLVARTEEEAMNARRESARLREELQLAKDYGYMPPEDPAKPPAASSVSAAPSSANFDASKFLTRDEMNKTYATFANMEGEAIAMANDLAMEYAHLTGGKSLFEYETQIGDRTLRGMRALRAEAIAKNQPLDALVSQKFDFPGKRLALAQAREKEREDAIRRDEREKTRAEVAAQFGNPNMAVPRSSTRPFFPERKAESGFPWDKETGEVDQNRLKADRVRRALETQAKSGVM